MRRRILGVFRVEQDGVLQRPTWPVGVFIRSLTKTGHLDCLDFSGRPPSFVVLEKRTKRRLKELVDLVVECLC